MAITSGKTAAAPARQLVSMSVGSFTQGGLIDDIDVEITDAQTAPFDFNGQVNPPSPCLVIEFTDANGAQHVQYYSAGKPEDWEPSEDGRGFYSLSGKSGVNESTNLGKFLKSLVEAGFPDDKIAEGDLKVVIGTKCHVLQVVQERKGLIRTGKNADRPPSTLLVSKIHSLPGAAGVGGKATSGKSTAAVGGKSNGAAKTAPATTAAAPVATEDAGEDIDSVIVEAILETFAGGADSIAKKDLTKLVFAKFAGKDAQLKNKAVIRSGRPDFLSGLADQGIAFDGATLTMAG